MLLTKSKKKKNDGCFRQQAAASAELSPGHFILFAKSKQKKHEENNQFKEAAGCSSGYDPGLLC